MSSWQSGPWRIVDMSVEHQKLRFNLDKPLDREAWEIIQAVPSGKRSRFIMNAIIAHEQRQVEGSSRSDWRNGSPIWWLTAFPIVPSPLPQQHRVIHPGRMQTHWKGAWPSRTNSWRNGPDEKLPQNQPFLGSLCKRTVSEGSKIGVFDPSVSNQLNTVTTAEKLPDQAT